MLGILLLLPAQVRAESDPPGDVVGKRLRLIVGEAGFGGEVDHAAMLHAFERLAARVGDYGRALLNHIPWWRQGAPPNKPWVAHLTTACDEPEGWPTRLDWTVHRVLCFQAVRRVRDYLAGKLKDPCRGRPDQWRARGKPSRKARRKWAQIGCRGPDGVRSIQNFFNTRLPL